MSAGGLAVQPQRQNIAAGAHRGQSRAPIEQFGLAEAVARVEHVERHFVVVIRALHHARPPADEDVDGVGGLSLGAEDSAKREGDRDEPLHDTCASVVRKKSENRKFVEDARVGHRDD